MEIQPCTDLGQWQPGEEQQSKELSLPCADSVQMLFKEHSLEVAQALKSKEGNNS